VAVVVLDRAEDALGGLGGLPTQADQLQCQLDTLREPPAGAPRLTTAELRLLPLLSTRSQAIQRLQQTGLPVI
jgi:hypothetical protein